MNLPIYFIEFIILEPNIVFKLLGCPGVMVMSRYMLWFANNLNVIFL